MMGMREHIHRLYGLYGIFFRKQLKVTRLGSRVATDIHDLFRGYFEQFIHQFCGHPGPWRVGYDYVRPAMDSEKGIITYFGHVPRKKTGMPNLVERRIFTGIVNGFRDKLHADHPACPVAEENANAPGSAIQIINRFFPAELSLIHISEP